MAHTTVQQLRLPRTWSELWWWLWWNFNVSIPTVPVCKGHVSPFAAIAAAYFTEDPVIVVKASRALAGKTWSMSKLIVAEAITYGVRTNLLGGSLEQSLNAHDGTKEAWDYEDPFLAHRRAPSYLLKGDPEKRETKLDNGAVLRVLAASTRSVRGPHPPRLRLDEIDEMDWEVFTGALGQPLPQYSHWAIDNVDKKFLIDENGIWKVPQQIYMASTHHYPNKTMQRVLSEMVPQNNWQVLEWCYKESMVKPLPANDFLRREELSNGAIQTDGWLTEKTKEQVRATVPRIMWETEYELQEPSIEGRAFLPEQVEAAFANHHYGKPDGADHVFMGEVDAEVKMEEFDPLANYVVAADWAKAEDWTIIAVYRRDVNPWRCVYWKRMGRQAWPLMIAEFNITLSRWATARSSSIHDATGLGSVISDYLIAPPGFPNMEPLDVWMAGRPREMMFSDYITGIEQGGIVFPRIDFAYREHKYVTRDDLFRSGTSFHAPDSVVNGALAWSTRQFSPGIFGGSAPAGGAPKAPGEEIGHRGRAPR